MRNYTLFSINKNWDKPVSIYEHIQLLKIISVRLTDIHIYICITREKITSPCLKRNILIDVIIINPNLKKAHAHILHSLRNARAPVNINFTLNFVVNCSYIYKLTHRQEYKSRYKLYIGIHTKLTNFHRWSKKRREFRHSQTGFYIPHRFVQHTCNTLNASAALYQC